MRRCTLQLNDANRHEPGRELSNSIIWRHMVMCQFDAQYRAGVARGQMTLYRTSLVGYAIASYARVAHDALQAEVAELSAYR